MATLTAERDSLELRRVEMDRQLELSGVKIRDNRMRMNRIRNCTELLALQREIDLSKEANAQIEEELLRVMETLETLAAQLAAAQEALQAARSAGGGRGGRRAAPRPRPCVRRSRPSAARATSWRPAWIRRCAASTSMIFDRRGGNAVVAAADGICTGCRMRIPPQFYNELLKFRDASASARTATASSSGGRRPSNRAALEGAAPSAPVQRSARRRQAPLERRSPARRDRRDAARHVTPLGIFPIFLFSKIP